MSRIGPTLYYDEPGDVPPFPGYFDRPSFGAGTILSNNGGNDPASASISFETWLVCVLNPNPDPADPGAGNANTIRYNISPLFGFTWGFTATLNSATSGVLSSQTLSTINAPSANWSAALNQTYGAGGTTDRYNVTVTNNCDLCLSGPEPGSPVTMASGLLLIAGVFLVRRRLAA